MTFSATGLPTGLQIDPESGVITGTLDSNASQQGPYTVTVTATDSAGATTTSDFLINAINDPVEARPATPINLQDGQVIDLPVTNLFNSPDGDRLSYAVSGLPDGLQFDTRTGVISGTVPSDASENGPFTITVTADDGQGGSATTDLLLDVTNPAPTAVPGSADAIPNLIPGEPTRIDTSAFIIDPDGDSLTFTAAGLPEGLSIDPDTGLVTGTPPQTATNDTPYTITLTVTDGQGGTVTTQFEVIVGRNAAAPVQELIDLGTHNDKNVAESVEVTEAPTTINEVISPNQLAKTETRITDTLYTEPSWDGRMATDSQNFNFQGGVSRSQVSLGDSDGDLIVEATIREGIVYVQLWETLSTSSTEMTNWLIEAIDGELPAWIDVTDTGLLIVNRPADATEVSFRVRAILDGTDVLSGEYEIDLSSGEVTLDGQVERRPANFNEQVEWKSHQSERQAASLTAALNLTK